MNANLEARRNLAEMGAACCKSSLRETSIESSLVVLRPGFYTKAESIWEALGSSHGGIPEVKLLRSSWLIKFARTREALPRRQDLERRWPDAFLDLATLRSLKKGSHGQLPIVVIS